MPLHPLIVHFPIALLITAAVIEIINVFLKKENVSRTGTILLVLGVISGIVSLLTGDGAEEFAYKNWGNVIHNTVELHSLLAGVSTAIFGVAAVIKLFSKWIPLGKNVLKSIVVVLCIAGTITLATTGHLGGKVVYEHDQLTSANNTTQTGDHD